jgi:hypothetical protein
VLVGTATVSPYGVTDNVSGVSNGAHSYSAKAYDAANNATTSAGVSVTVNNPDTTAPVVSLTSPASGSVVSNTITLTASATDNVGVTSVWFYRDGNTLGQVTTAPFRLSDNTTAVGNGVHTYSARALDAAGNATTANDSVTVNNVVSSLPSGKLLWLQANLAQYQARVNAVTVDHANNVIAVGYFLNYVDFGSGLITSAGGNDVFIAKYSPQGVLLWVRRMGGIWNDNARSVAVDSQNNIVVAGYFQGSADFGGTVLTATGVASGYSTDVDVFVAKYSPGSAGVAGGLMWARNYGSPSTDMASGVAVDGSDNVLVTSASGGTVVFGNGITLTGHGGTDVAVAKLSSTNGATLWAQLYGGSMTDTPNGVAADRNGDVLVTGSFGGSGNLGGTAIAGSAASGIFVAKYAGTDGSYKWSSVASGVAGYGIATDPGTTNVFITGQSGSGLFVNAYGPSGNLLWNRTYGTMTDAGYGIAVDGSGNLALTGTCGSVDWLGNGVWSTGVGFFVASLTTAGTFRWEVQANNQSYGYGVAFDSAGHVTTGGSLYGTVDFGGISATAGAGGVYNAFITQYTK